MNWGTNFVLQLSADYAELERKMYANLMQENKRAKRMPARVRKRMYGAAKQPYTITHDCIQVNDKRVINLGLRGWL